MGSLNINKFLLVFLKQWKTKRDFRTRYSPRFTASLRKLFGCIILTSLKAIPWTPADTLLIPLGTENSGLNQGKKALIAGGRTGEPKTDVVVAFIWRVPVAVSRTYVLCFIVPGATAQHTARLGITLA